MTLEGQGNFKCEISRKLCEIEFVSTEDNYEIAYELSWNVDLIKVDLLVLK